MTPADPAVLDGLASLSTAGWQVAVVTNGGTIQQNLKLDHTGIGEAVDYSCISESVGVRKPDPRIFEIAGGINANLSTIRIGSYHQVDTPEADHHLTSVLDAFPLILAS